MTLSSLASSASSFPLIVIEVPFDSYFNQSKTLMRVASCKQGGPTYGGPERLCLARWKHIKKFYIVEPSSQNLYLAQSLTHHPHYSVLQTEVDEFEVAIKKFQMKKRKNRLQVIRICANENFHDDFLTVVNQFDSFPSLNKYITDINDENLLNDIATASIDKNRGNSKIDFGYSCGQNLARDAVDFGTTRPRILDRTLEAKFLEIQLQLSSLSDIVCETHRLPLFHRVDNIHKDFAEKLQPGGVIPAWRLAASSPNQVLEVHEDSNNDSRELMSPVVVFSRVYETSTGPMRLTKIGYSRQSLIDAITRETLIKPIVRRFKKWVDTQPPYLSKVSSELFQMSPNSCIPGVIEIPCHLVRSVGISPYLHGIIHLQSLLGLTRHQCVAILYNCVTNESAYFFQCVYEHIITLDKHDRDNLSSKSPVELGLWYHSMIWKMISDKKELLDDTVLPRRHQPHNGSRTIDSNISMSIVNLIKLTDQFCFLDGLEVKKQYYHSKAIAILMKHPNSGGCHACGGLTSQTLLYTLACVGLVPICITRWGEMAGTDTSAYLEEHYGLVYSEGRVEQFLSCCVASSPGDTEEQTENKICKWIRSEKK